MTRFTAHIEDREGGRYFVYVESSYPNQRVGKDFAVGYEAAFDRAKEFCREFGVDDAKALPTMHPALQADIDRAQAAQEAAGDVAPNYNDEVTPADIAVLNRIVPDSEFADYIDSADVDNRTEPVVFKRGPGRPRKEPPGDVNPSPA